MDIHISTTAWDILSGVSGVVIALAALGGLGVWWQQISGKAAFDLARRTLVLANKWVQAFDWATFPIGSSAEYASRVHAPDEQEGERRILDEWYARQQRTEPLRGYLAELYEAKWEARLVLDDASYNAVDKLCTVLATEGAELAATIDTYFEMMRTGRPLDHEREQQMREYRSIIYSAGGNPSKAQIAEAMGTVTEALRDFVRPKRWWKRLWRSLSR